MWLHLISSNAEYTPMQWAWVDPWLVAVSVTIALITSTMALQMVHLANKSSRSQTRYLAQCSGSISLAGGIWCMHFIGMLAFAPYANSSFSSLHSLLSALPILGFSALIVTSLRTQNTRKSLHWVGPLSLGVGVAVMHFWGISAAHSSSSFYYVLQELALVCLIILGIATLPFILYVQLQSKGWRGINVHMASGITLGVCVSCMHYIAMGVVYVDTQSIEVLHTDTVAAHWPLVITTFVICLLLAGLILAMNISVRRQQLFKKIRLSESRLRAVVDTAVDGIIMIEGNGTISAFNPAAEKLLGWSAQEVIGRNVNILMPQPHQGAHDGYLQRHLATGHTSIIGSGREVRAMHKSGELVEIRLAVGRVPHLEQPLFVGFLTDIRQWKATEISLQRSEEQHRTLISNIPGVTFRRRADATWHPIFLSKAVETLTGWPSEALIRTPERMQSLVFAEDWEPLQKTVRDAMQKGLSYHHEYRLRHRDGSTRWISESGRGAVDDRGETQWVDGVLIDNTETKARNAEFVGTVNAINRAMAVIDYSMDGLIQHANDNFLHLFGYTLEELQGQHFRIFCIDTTESYEEDALMWSQLQQGKFVTRECQALTKDGRIIWVETSFNPILNANGKPFRITQLLSDITARRSLAQALLEAKERAEAAAAARSTFLANMSHEIRTPMNAIIGFSEALLETPLRPTQERYLKTVHRSARSMLRLLNDILDTAKLDKGAVTLEMDDFVLSDTCQLVLGAQRIQAEKKGLKLLLQIDPCVPTYLHGDALRIQQILTNLMGNAVKFTEKGHVQLHASYAHESGTLHLRVIDTGIGIAPEKLDSIFDPFSQADVSTTRRYGGTGLGTTISRQLAELMGGRIWATSQLGGGSEFHVQLNLKPGQAPHQPSFQHQEILPALHILAADDVPQNLELLALVLAKHGHQLTMAHDGQEAVKLRQTDHFDLVLMDLQMPKLDGLDAAKAIRSWEQANQQEPIPIIALSASVLEQDRRSAWDAGMNGFATKPLEIEHLLAEMARVLDFKDSPSGHSTPKRPRPVLVAPHVAQDEHPEDDSVVDWSTGLQLWGGKESLRAAWARFMAEQSYREQELRQLMEQPDWNTAIAIIHRMRGAAGNLALRHLHSVLVQMEASARQQDDTQFAQYLPVMGSALAQVEALLSASAPYASHAALPSTQPSKADAIAALDTAKKQQLAALLDELTSALQASEIPSSTLEQLSELLPPSHCTPIQAAIENFDFDQALASAQALQAILQPLDHGNTLHVAQP